jgi:hypothetical protein
VAAVGVVVYMIKRARTFAGYGDLRETAEELRRLLKGEIFRDGEDLVISGNHRRLPAVVRFSYSENTPGLNMRMEAPATFSMSVTPKAANVAEGRVVMRTPDEKFDTRFVTRTDHPTQAKMFTNDKLVMAQLQKLCCSGNTFFSISSRSMELSELAIPTSTKRHVMDHMDSMLLLARALADMPGAGAIRIQEIQKERSIPVRIAIAVGLVAVVVAVFAATRAMREQVDAAALQVGDVPPSGILPADAQLIRNLAGWRLATAEDFDSAGVAWLRTRGREASGRIEGDFSGASVPTDAAYILSRDDGSRRVVILADRRKIFDAAYDDVYLAARVRARAFPSIEWAGSAPDPPQGDGVLLVRGPTAADGLVIYQRQGRILSAVPVDYQNMPLE